MDQMCLLIQSVETLTENVQTLQSQMTEIRHFMEKLDRMSITHLVTGEVESQGDAAGVAHFVTE